ncbi:hypothetical protein OQA88_10867 [Cercophora sp. LCS_1]
MRPKRTRGIRKRYTEDQFALEGDDEPISIPEEQSGDDDFDAQAEGQQAPDDDDLEDADPTSEDDDENQSDGGAMDDGTAQQPGKKVRNLGAGMIQSRKGVHDIPNYPLETRIVTRVYAGPLRRYARYSALRDSMYGPEYHRIKIVWDLDNRWREYSLLPPKLSPRSPKGITPSPWVRPGFEAAQEKATLQWYAGFGSNCSGFQQSEPLVPGHAESLMPQTKGGLAVMLGPWDQQSEVLLNPREGLTVSPSGAPIEDFNGTGGVNGWMIDTGGIPLALAWAPSRRTDLQILAVASIPFQDQELVSPTPATPEVVDTTGCIQLWSFRGDKPEGGLASPARKPPKLLAAQLFDWGRPKRMQWCPVPMDSAGVVGLLAVLCGDGKARIIEVKNIDDTADTQYEWFKEPIATLGVMNDYNVNVTCLAWINVNRIVLGHSDGSLTLWSIHPQRLLQRFGVHSNYVIDICSGYPSNPYMVATIPVGGCATLTDLSQPSSEATYFPVPAISFQPNMLCWNEFMQGYMALYPSSTPTTTVAFLHHRFFCQARSTITGPNSITCVSAGATHPFVLVGSADGSVYGCNALQKLFKQKGEPLQKIKVFEHEFRPIEGDPEDGGDNLRGAVRILRGWLPEVNDDPRTEKRKEVDRKKRLARKKKARGKKGAEDDPDDREDEINTKLASRAITHEPLTRITAIEWNPNLPFSCWAACAMGSGLIKVLDLGVA